MKPIQPKLVWRGKHFQVYCEGFELQREFAIEYVCRKDGIRIIGMDAFHNILIAKEFRFELNTYDWRIVGGRLNDENESKVKAAKREFREETGYVAKTWEFLWTTTLELTIRYQHHFFLATQLNFDKTSIDEGELLNIYWIPIQTAYEMAMKGDIKEEISALAIARLFFEIKNGLRKLN